MTTTRSKKVYTVSTVNCQSNKNRQQYNKLIDVHPKKRRRKTKSDKDYLNSESATESDPSLTNSSLRQSQATPESTYEVIPSLPSPPSTPVSARLSNTDSIIDEIVSQLPPSSTNIDQLPGTQSSLNQDAALDNLSSMLDWNSSIIMNAFLPIFEVNASPDADVTTTSVHPIDCDKTPNVEVNCHILTSQPPQSIHTPPLVSYPNPTAEKCEADGGYNSSIANVAENRHPSVGSVCSSQQLDKKELMLRPSIRPTVYEEYSSRCIDWCRYCGATQSSQAAAFRPGIWGTRTLCNKHGCDVKGYGRLNKLPRLLLEAFAQEKREDRLRPIIQDFCHVCFKDGSEEIVVMCDGCWQAFHPSCFGGAIPQDVINGTSSKWFCDPICMLTRQSDRIDALLPKVTLPYMRLDAAPSVPTTAEPIQPLKISSQRSRTVSMPSSSQIPIISSPPSSQRPRAITHQRTRPRSLSVVEPCIRTRKSDIIPQLEFLQQDIAVPSWTIGNLLVADQSQIEASTSKSASPSKRKLLAMMSGSDPTMLEEVGDQEEGGEDLSDGGFELRHAKYEEIERRSRMGTLL